MYLDILLAAVVVFLFFRGLTLAIKILPLSRSVKLYTGYIMPVIELVLWVGFIIWSVLLLYKAYNTAALIVAGTLTILFIVPMWFLIKDFLYGVILKVQRKIDLNTTIEIEGLTGIVIKTGHLSFDIRTKNGNIDTIPYNKILSKIITRHGGNINLDTQLISFRMDSAQDINVVIPGLKFTLINAPWVAASQDPIVKDIRQENGEYILDVVVYTMKQDHAKKIQEYVTNKMGILTGVVRL